MVVGQAEPGRGSTADAGVVVAGAWHGRRVGAALPRALIGRAQGRAVAWLTMNVQHGNTLVRHHQAPGHRPPRLLQRLPDLPLSWDIKEVDMTDVLIRDVPDDVIAALDAHAGRLGLSRSEYVRRRLAQDAAMSSSPVTVQDLARFTEVFGDLADPDVMSRAWQ